VRLPQEVSMRSKHNLHIIDALRREETRTTWVERRFHSMEQSKREPAKWIYNNRFNRVDETEVY